MKKYFLYHRNPTTLDYRPEFARPSGSGRISRMPKNKTLYRNILSFISGLTSRVLFFVHKITKIIFCIVLFLFSIGLANAASLSKDMPKNTEPGKTITVTFRISGVETGEVFSIEEMTANELSIKDYKIEGAEKTEAEAEYEKKIGTDGKKTRYSWVYQATASNPKLTYTIDIPLALEGNYVFDTVYILPPAKMDNIKSNLRIAKIVCGDGYCEGNENLDSCQEDCPKAEKKEGAEATGAAVTGAVTGGPISRVLASPDAVRELKIAGIALIILLGAVLYYFRHKKQKKSIKAKKT